MDGYTKAAIKEELAKRSPCQVKAEIFFDGLVNGPAVYGIILFYGFWGWVILDLLGK